jgi:serine/threonine protein kinase
VCHFVLFLNHRLNTYDRDIHWGNVLVSIRYCTGEVGPVFESIEAVISDLGEGQQIRTQSHGRTYYGNEAFWAPEVRKGQHHTAASDIYAIGCLFLEMVQLHWGLVQPKEPGSTAQEIRRELLAIIMACLETNAEDRPEARELAYELDDLEFPSKDDKDQQGEETEVLAIEPERLQLLLEERCNPKEEQNEEGDDIVV